MTTPPPPPPPPGPSGWSGPPHQPPGQQPPPNPYGQPPQGGAYGYGGHQPPPPGGWGAPPPPPPPDNNRTKIAIIVSVCAVVVAIAVTLSLVLGGSSDEDSSDAKGSDSSQSPTEASDDASQDDASQEPSEGPTQEPSADASATPADQGDYELAIAQAILDDEYKLADDMSKQLQNDIDGAAGPLGEVTATGGSYTTPGEAETLLVAGYQGDIGAPTLAKHDFLRGTAEGANAEVAVPTRAFNVRGVNSAVSCQVVAQSQSGVKVNMPVCAWAEGDILFSLLVSDPGQINTNARNIDLKAEAERLVKAYGDFRVEKD